MDLDPLNPQSGRGAIKICLPLRNTTRERVNGAIKTGLPLRGIWSDFLESINGGKRLCHEGGVSHLSDCLMKGVKPRGQERSEGVAKVCRAASSTRETKGGTVLWI